MDGVAENWCVCPGGDQRWGGGGGGLLPQAGLYGYSFGNRIQSTPSKIETFGTDTKCPF